MIRVSPGFRSCVLISPPTEHGTGSRFKGLALQTPPLQEVAVGRAGVTREAAGPVQGAQVEKHRALVVTHKVRFTCGRKQQRHSQYVCVCVDERVSNHVCVCSFTCEDGFRTAGLIGSAVGVEVDVTVSSSQPKCCTGKHRFSPDTNSDSQQRSSTAFVQESEENNLNIKMISGDFVTFIEFIKLFQLKHVS